MSAEPLTNAIMRFMPKRFKRIPFLLPSHENSEKLAACNLEEDPNNAGTLVLNFPPAGLRNKILLFTSYPVSDTLLYQPTQTKILSYYGFNLHEDGVSKCLKFE